ncbi:TIR domain-containing protein [Caenimonas sedimenti]|uniref:TIR domain-containing protein n=1 Tax=Caenimonas sedimenti TaxID=2596921 RepID=A0A562ZVX9_9BURK|nr:TIR domain-containing protein [Caenimonas sedimenti]
MPAAGPVELFYSYAHEDEVLREELQGHLKILERRGLVKAWHDRKIVAGQDWSGAIDAHLHSAELVLLLVSSDFIGSDYIMSTELEVAMRRHAQQQATVVPIIVRPVDLSSEDAEDFPFLKLQGLPTDLKAVTSWSNRDEAWTNVAKGLRAAVMAIRARRPPAPAAMVRNTRGGGTSNFAHAPAKPAADDAVLQQLVGGVVGQVVQAQEARGQPPMDASAVDALRHQARVLVDVPDQRRILWVDDQPQGNRHEAAALAKLQIEVVQVLSTDDAMDRLQEDAEAFDLVISDWERAGEPPEAGLRLFTRMRDAGLAVPVVYYHGAQGGLRRQRADQVLALGAAGEAVLPGELLALVAKALGGG